MSTPAEITEKIVTELNGGTNPTDGKWDYPYIEANLSRWRQRGISVFYNGSKELAGNMFIPEQWYQSFEVSFVAAEQRPTANYIIATVPPAATINKWLNGSVFLGDQDSGINFSQITSPAYASDLLQRGDLNDNVIGYVGISGQIKFYGNKQLKRFYVQRVLANPEDAPNFDIDADYPACENLEAIMISLAVAELRPTEKIADVINDGVPTGDNRTVKSNIT